MHFGPFLRRAAAIGSAITLVASASAAYAAGPPPPTPTHVTVTISDKGYDQPIYKVGTTGTGSDNIGTITFKNVGTMVHTATAISGSNGMSVQLQSRIDGNGNASYCYNNLPGQGLSQGCPGLAILDTGGIAPGGSVTFSLPSEAKGSNLSFTSATDCLNGNATPGFNCTPSTVSVVSVFGHPYDVISGSNFGAPGSPDCIQSVFAPQGQQVCIINHRTPGKTAGSPFKPVSGSLAVTVDDINGYTPATAFVTPGTTITWTNNGTRVHDVSILGNPVFNIQGTAQPGTMQPGQSVSLTVGCPTGSNACPLLATSSNVQYDLVPDNLMPPGVRADFCGFSPTNFLVRIGKVQSTSPQCGSSGMTGTIIIVPPPAS